MVVTALGNNPATLTLLTSIKIVDCSSGNVISGGTWNLNQLLIDLTPMTDVPITPFIFSKPDCVLSAYTIEGIDASIVGTNIV